MVSIEVETDHGTSRCDGFLKNITKLASLIPNYNKMSFQLLVICRSGSGGSGNWVHAIYGRGRLCNSEPQFICFHSHLSNRAVPENHSTWTPGRLIEIRLGKMKKKT